MKKSIKNLYKTINITILSIINKILFRNIKNKNNLIYIYSILSIIIYIN